MIERESEIKTSRQCEILGVSRSSHYCALSDIFNVNIRDEELMGKTDKIYADYPFYLNLGFFYHYEILRLQVFLKYFIIARF